jgi:hypothetical protein
LRSKRSSLPADSGARPLRHIQFELERLYDVSLSHAVEDFVVDEAEARDALGPTAVARGEVLLVREDADGVAVGLYVDADSVRSLDTGRGDAWSDERFGAACLATEGVSHFVYLLFRAERDGDVSALELELQAEVDKYATGLLAGFGAGLIASRERAPAALLARSRALRRRLFDEAELLDPPGTEEGDRYRAALSLASRFVAHLEQTYVVRGDLPALANALRRYYRLGGQAKMRASGRGL